MLRVITGISRGFVGLSRKEAIETWLELVSSDATPEGAASEIAETLSKEGDVPNLDLAVARCLQQQTFAWGKKHACAQWLLRVIPPGRRGAVVWRYLDQASSWELGERLTIEEVLSWISPRGKAKLKGPLCEVIGGLIARPAAGRARYSALETIGDCEDPTPRLVTNLFAAAEDVPIWIVMHPLVSLADKHPELRPQVLAGLNRLSTKIATARCLPPPHSPNPQEEVQKAIEAVGRR